MRSQPLLLGKQRTTNGLIPTKGYVGSPKEKGVQPKKKKTNPFLEESISEADDHLSDPYTTMPWLLEQAYRYSHPTLDMS